MFKFYKLIFHISIILFTISCIGQSTKKTQEYNKKILAQATEMGQYYLDENYVEFIKKIYPGQIDITGGKDNMLKLLNSALLQLKNNGITIDSVRYTKPNKIINTGQELQTTLTEIIYMSIPDGRMVGKSTLIAISTNDGKNWFFLSTGKQNLKSMQKNMPNLSNKLVIPKSKKPIVYRN